MNYSYLVRLQNHRREQQRRQDEINSKIDKMEREMMPAFIVGGFLAIVILLLYVVK